MHTRHARSMCLSGQDRGRRRRGEKSGWQLLWVTARLSNIPRVNQTFFFLMESLLTEVWGVLKCLSLYSSPVRADKSIILFYLLSSHHFFSVSSFVTPLNPLTRLSSLFAVRCRCCAEAISPAELVMRAGAAVFHLHCFTCSVCSCHLKTGDRCVLREGRLLCAREDYHQCLASPTSSDTGTSCAHSVQLCSPVCTHCVETDPIPVKYWVTLSL